jgi:hypothetical protein
MAYDFASLKTHSNQGSGVSDILLFAPITEFTTISGPTITASPGVPVPGEEVTISADHVFPANAGFIEVLCAPFVNQMMAATTGDTGNKKFNPKVEVFVPGSYAVLHEFAKNIMNLPAILLVKEGNCEAGFYYQIGNSCNFAWIDVMEWGTGTTKDGKKGYKITWEASAAGIYTYTGTVTKKA